MASVRILTAGELKGAAWIARYPERAGDLVVVARAGKRRKTRLIGPDTPENRAKAERQRDAWQAALDAQEMSDAGLVAPLFSDAASEYQRRHMGSHAWKTREARRYQFSRMATYFGDVPLDAIDEGRVVALYDHLRETLTDRTAQKYVDALSAMYRALEVPNPVPAARDRIAAKRPRTAETRALDDANVCPVPAEAMGRLLPRLRGDLLTTVLLCYEAGLRLGEATGLRWEGVIFGADEDDTRRAVIVSGSRVGKRTGKTKSGRERRVSMSRRLRAHLLAEHMRQGRPARGWIVEQSWPKNIHARLERAATAAKVAKPRFKDFRDTYASTLITHGIVLKWVSLQLGHGSVAVTERHYARYMAVEGYQNPWQVPAGCLPPDLFATLDGWRHHGVTERHHESASARD